jgi:hypothetical protein
MLAFLLADIELSPLMVRYLDLPAGPHGRRPHGATPGRGRRAG